MEKTSGQEAVSGRMRRTHPAAVLVSILVRSRSDSGTWHRYPSTALDQASDATPEFPYAIPLPRWGRWVQRLRAKVGEAGIEAALLVLFCATPAGAQVVDNTLPTEQVVISASRSGGVRSDLLGSSATVLLPIDFQLRQIDIVSDILRDVPGVAVSRTGPVGQLTQVRIRGAEANHTLVLIDGIKASDPFYGEFDFATLIADDVAKVEVLRGEQSALYGSDAIGGGGAQLTPPPAPTPRPPPP